MPQKKRLKRSYLYFRAHPETLIGCAKIHLDVGQGASEENPLYGALTSEATPPDIQRDAAQRVARLLVIGCVVSASQARFGD